MGDRRRHAAGCRNLLCLQQGLFNPFPRGYIAQNLGRANNPTALVFYRRNGERNIEQLTTLGATHGLKMLDPASGTDVFHDCLFIGVKILRNELQNRRADHLVCGITEKTRGCNIPTFMMPFRSLLTITSSEDSTIAASSPRRLELFSSICSLSNRRSSVL